jgi:hypothetical protein
MTEIVNLERMKLCPKFNKCSAMICPLDEKWRERVHIQGDPVCAVLLTYKKENGFHIIDYYLKYIYLLQKVIENYNLILERWGSIRRACKIAESSPAKLGTQPG